MNKQEEIRDTLITNITKAQKLMLNSEIVALADKILRNEDSQGVVIKVDKPLPDAFDINDDVMSALEYRKKLEGYSFFEPLIEPCCKTPCCDYHILDQKPLNAADVFEQITMAGKPFPGGYCGT